MTRQHILAFDVETYPDSELVEATSGTDLAHFREGLKQRTGSDFLPPVYHIPIAIAFLRVDPVDHIDVEVHTGSLADERALIEVFWQRCNETLGTEDRATRNGTGLLVSFNGTEFDIPVLELRSLKYALRGNMLVRDPAVHFDVPLFLANYQPARRRGLRLLTLSKLTGLPGKAMIEGSQVQSYFDAGRLAEVGKYCLLDVLQTYLLFLRCQLLAGMTQSEYESAIRSLSFFLSASSDPNVKGAFAYLEDAVRNTLGVESVS